MESGIDFWWIRISELISKERICICFICSTYAAGLGLLPVKESSQIRVNGAERNEEGAF